jgi:hypothetical protein
LTEEHLTHSSRIQPVKTARGSRRAAVLLWLAAAVVSSACAAPPNREIADAQNALKAADAAHAAQYAPESYTSAADAYRLANEAVMNGDYRLALNKALESRERAQTAAREADEARIRIRDEVRRSMAEVAVLLANASTRIEEAEQARVSRQVVRESRQALTQLNEDVQKADAAMMAEEYARAQPLVDGVETRLNAIIARLDAALKAQSPKRK